MLDIYKTSTGIWIVTYQRNEHSPITTLYEGGDSNKALTVFNDYIELWA